MKALEVPSDNTEGGDVPLDTAIKLCHAHLHVEDDKASKEGQVQPGGGCEIVERGRGAGAEDGRYEVQSI